MKFNFSAIPAALDVFHAGKKLNNAAAWKNGQILGNVLIASITLARILGLNLPIPDDMLMAFAGGAVAIANGILTVATSSKVGLHTS